MIVGWRPSESAVKAPIAAPIGAPNDIRSANQNEVAMLSPSFTKKVGTQVTNPYSHALIVKSATSATIVRDKSGGANSAENETLAIAGAGGTGARGATVFEDSSKDVTMRSASAVRPTLSSQRGDSGSCLRRYQMTSAPRPPITNMGRQPNAGMIHEPSSAVAGSPLTTNTAISASHLPRARAGANSVIVEYPTTFSAPKPMPMTNRITTSHAIDGANAAQSAAKPKISRFACY